MCVCVVGGDLESSNLAATVPSKSLDLQQENRNAELFLTLGQPTVRAGLRLKTESLGRHQEWACDFKNCRVRQGVLGG